MQWLFILYISLIINEEDFHGIRDDAAQEALDEYITKEINSELTVYTYEEEETKCVLEVTQDEEICHEE